MNGRTSASGANRNNVSNTGRCLEAVFVYNPTISVDEDTADENILYYQPQTTSLNEQMNKVGLCTVFGSFADIFKTSHDPKWATTKRSMYIMLQPEPNLYYGVIIRRDRFPAALDDTDQPLVDTITKILSISHRLLRMSYGSIQSYFDARYADAEKAATIGMPMSRSAPRRAVSAVFGGSAYGKVSGTQNLSNSKSENVCDPATKPKHWRSIAAGYIRDVLAEGLRDLPLSLQRGIVDPYGGMLLQDGLEYLSIDSAAALRVAVFTSRLQNAHPNTLWHSVLTLNGKVAHTTLDIETTLVLLHFVKREQQREDRACESPYHALAELQRGIAATLPEWVLIHPETALPPGAAPPISHQAAPAPSASSSTTISTDKVSRREETLGDRNSCDDINGPSNVKTKDGKNNGAPFLMKSPDTEKVGGFFLNFFRRSTNEERTTNVHATGSKSTNDNNVARGNSNSPDHKVIKRFTIDDIRRPSSGQAKSLSFFGDSKRSSSVGGAMKTNIPFNMTLQPYPGSTLFSASMPLISRSDNEKNNKGNQSSSISTHTSNKSGNSSSGGLLHRDISAAVAANAAKAHALAKRMVVVASTRGRLCYLEDRLAGVFIFRIGEFVLITVVNEKFLPRAYKYRAGATIRQQHYEWQQQDQIVQMQQQRRSTSEFDNMERPDSFHSSLQARSMEEEAQETMKTVVARGLLQSIAAILYDEAALLASVHETQVIADAWVQHLINEIGMLYEYRNIVIGSKRTSALDPQVRMGGRKGTAVAAAVGLDRVRHGPLQSIQLGDDVENDEELSNTSTQNESNAVRLYPIVTLAVIGKALWGYSLKTQDREFAVVVEASNGEVQRANMEAMRVQGIISQNVSMD